MTQDIAYELQCYKAPRIATRRESMTSPLFSSMLQLHTDANNLLCHVSIDRRRGGDKVEHHVGGLPLLVDIETCERRLHDTQLSILQTELECMDTQCSTIPAVERAQHIGRALVAEHDQVLQQSLLRKVREQHMKTRRVDKVQGLLLRRQQEYWSLVAMQDRLGLRWYDRVGELASER